MDVRGYTSEMNPLNVVFQKVQHIETYLMTLIEESYKIGAKNHSDLGERNSKEVIFTNSCEIKQLVDEVLEHIRTNQEREHIPYIFQVYDENEQVKCMCGGIVSPGKISKRDIDWLMDLEREVYKNISHTEIHLTDLSNALAVSNRQLSRKIRGLLNLTPNKYIRILKMAKAKEWIDELRFDTLSEISYAVGYSDTHYFSKLFLRQYGVTPKDLIDSKHY